MAPTDDASQCRNPRVPSDLNPARSALGPDETEQTRRRIASYRGVESEASAERDQGDQW